MAARYGSPRGARSRPQALRTALFLLSALAAAAALRFDDPADGQCAEIRETIARIGLPAAVRRITGIDDDRLVAALVDAYARVPSPVGA